MLRYSPLLDSDDPTHFRFMLIISRLAVIVRMLPCTLGRAQCAHGSILLGRVQTI